MPKKAATEVNKSQAIREFLGANPDATNLQVASALNKEGLNVTANYVSTIKTNMKNKTKKKPGRKAAKPKATAAKKAAGPKKQAAAGKKQASTDKISLDELVQAKKFVAKLGGVEEAQQAIKAWKLLSD